MPLRLSVIMRNIPRILSEKSGVGGKLIGSPIMRSRTMMFLCSTLLALAPAAAQERMYKCVDARGKVYYTQVPPPECLGRDTQELNQSGTLIRKNPAVIPLTPAQEQAREAERRRKLEDEERSREKRRQELESEKEFYVKKPMPFKLKQEIANNEIQIRNQTVLLDAKKKEISRINAKYDADRRRYVELTGGKAGSQKR